MTSFNAYQQYIVQRQYIMTSFNAYQQYIVQRYSKYITSQNAKCI